MPRPQTKADLLKTADTEYFKLNEMLDSLTEKELDTPFDFSDDVKKTEAHWKRDKNVRDVVMHLYERHQLMLKWIQNNENGIRKPFLMEGYTWKSYGDMNQIFWKNCQNVSLEEAREKFDASHKEIMTRIEQLSNEELFAKGAFDWVGTSTIGSYFISTTSSHYAWAMKKIKAHRKKIND